MKIYENHRQDARYDEKDLCPTVTAKYGTGGGNVPLVLYNHHAQDGRLTESEGVVQTISARDGESGSLPLVVQEAYRISSDASNVMRSPNPMTGIKRVDLSPTLDTTIPSPSKAQGVLAIVSQENQGRVRKLTPVECERLQGFPDNWTRIPYRNKAEEQCPDSPRYKAIGNSWAVPCVRWIGQRIKNVLEK